MFQRMVRNGESFWTAVHDPFMARDATREDLRAVVREALEVNRGSYKGVVRLFNMPATDYRKLLRFLRKFDCHLPIHEFRTASARLPSVKSDIAQQAVVNE
jgi:hypothetical protein